MGRAIVNISFDKETNEYVITAEQRMTPEEYKVFEESIKNLAGAS